MSTLSVANQRRIASNEQRFVSPNGHRKLRSGATICTLRESLPELCEKQDEMCEYFCFGEVREVCPQALPFLAKPLLIEFIQMSPPRQGVSAYINCTQKESHQEAISVNRPGSARRETRRNRADAPTLPCNSSCYLPISDRYSRRQ